MVRWSILLLANILLLSGCVTSNEPAIELSATDMPAFAAVGEPVTFTMTGTGDLTSGHVGGHFWDASTEDPTADFSEAGGCAHVPGATTFPAEVTVTCTFEEPGMVYVRGHVRTDDSTTNFWTEEHAIDVRMYALTTDASDMTVAPGTDVMFNLTIAGDAGMSGHIGAHYWSEAVEDPTASFADQAGGCAHVVGEQAVPGTFQVTCSFDEAGTYHVHGHLRLGSQANFWAPGFQVVVS